ncbi:MAG: selenium cofactor biosynthesis protein YqeC [Brevefilum sp.]
MHLPEAIGLKRGDAWAFVGAGGKTSAMFALAHALKPPVVLTTTTHLGAWQAGLADEHYILNSPEWINSIDFHHQKTILLTGPSGADKRLAGLEDEILDVIFQRCKELALPLLIEADGAGQRYLKAPADYEPVIPEWVAGVVVMAGLGGLGKPLNHETVHRPEKFARLSGCEIGATVEAVHLEVVLSSKKGGLKSIPEGVRRVCFLNQAEGEALQEEGRRLARDLDRTFERVLVGSLHQPGQNGPIFSVHAQTAGVILAAGESDRLGRPKQLLDWEGVPFVRQVALNALAAGLTPLIAVTGASHKQVEDALEGLNVDCVYNPDWSTGQSTSVQSGISALQEGTDSAMFLLSDQPQIGPNLIRNLRARYSENRQPITAPMVKGQRGNPVLFSQSVFDALRQVRGDRGGRAVFDQFEVDWLPWDDERILLDVDEPGDYERLLEAFSKD